MFKKKYINAIGRELNQTTWKALVKSEIATMPVNKPFQSELLTETLYYHPRQDKIKGKIQYLEVRLSNYGERTLFYKDDNGIDSISWVQCIKHGLGLKLGDTSRADITNAFRQAIISDIQKYQRLNTFGDKGRCASCLEVYSLKSSSDTSNHIQVDHIEPFSDILSDFLKQQGISMESVQIDKTYNICTLLNTRLHDDWVDYHNNRARYQLLCKTCNLKKSNKNIFSL
jgi:hypothetical protein